MKVILGLATMIAVAAPAAAQRSHRIDYAPVPPTVIVTTTTSWQNPPPPEPVYQQPYQQPYIPYAPLPVDAAVFAGVRLEAQVGWDAFRNRDADDLVFGRGSGGRDGIVYGGELGFDVPFGRRATIGGYAGLEGSSVDSCYGDAVVSICTKPRLGLTLGGRLGLAVSPDALLYVKGGYSLTRLRLDAFDRLNPVNSVRSTGNLDGFHLGAGAEAALSRRVYGKLEYVYTRFGHYEDRDIGLDSGNVNIDRHQVKAGVGLRL